jgi:GTP-binding protein SAR1
MFLFQWFRDVLNFLGLFRKDAKIVFLGLDNAGKTTLLQMLKQGRVSSNLPTLYPNKEELMIGNIRASTFDLGGHETARRIWRDYFAELDGIVFIVDAADRTRFLEASEELSHLLDEPCLSNVPIVVLGNKIDIPVAASEDELRRSLNLYNHMTFGKAATKEVVASRPIEVFMVSIAKRMGYAEAFEWLAQFIK